MKIENLGEVIDLYLDRLVDMQLDEQLPLYPIPVRPIQRSLEMVRRQQEQMPWLRAAP